MRCDSCWKIAARDIGRENRLGKLDATESLLEENKILVKFIRKLSFFLSLSLSHGYLISVKINVRIIFRIFMPV